MAKVHQPKGRYVLPELFHDSELNRLEREMRQFGALRYTLIGIWTYADANGRFKWDVPRMHLALTANVILLRRFQTLLDALLDNQYIHRYNAEGEFDPNGAYCHVRTWGKYQWTDNRENTHVEVACPCEKGAAPAVAKKLDTTKRERKSKREQAADRQSEGTELPGKLSCKYCAGRGNVLVKGEVFTCACVA